MVWDNKEAMFLIELTVPFETNLEGARERKQAKYADLLKECKRKSYASLITVQVGARGYLDQESLHNLYQMLGVRVQSETRRKFEEDLTRAAVRGSYEVWTMRNWKDPN